MRGSCSFEFVAHVYSRGHSGEKCSQCFKKIKSHCLLCTVCNSRLHDDCVTLASSTCLGRSFESWRNAQRPVDSGSVSVPTSSISSITGYIRHGVSRKWIHPNGGIAKSGVLVVLHKVLLERKKTWMYVLPIFQDPPDSYRFEFEDCGTAMLVCLEANSVY